MRQERLTLDTAHATLQLLQANQGAGDGPQRRFVLLNRTREVWPYQIAVLWQQGTPTGHSGVGQLEEQGPYAQWLSRLARALAEQPAGILDALQLPPDLAEDWMQYWPAHALWLPGAAGDGFVLVRELPWSEREQQEIDRWWQMWRHDDRQACGAARPPGAAWRRPWRRTPGRGRRLTMLLVPAALLAVLCYPVSLTLRAPGELVPRHPVVIRAAMDGTVRALKVEPNQPVKAGQVLVELDNAGWQARLQVAQHALATAEAEWRQVNQLVLTDPRARSQLAAAQGRHEERRAEVAYLAQQVMRTTLVAPQEGFVLIQDPGGWPGRTVAAGEAIMKLAQPRDQEIEAWLAAGDAVDLPTGTRMALHLASRPGQPLGATLNLYAYEAEQRPDLGLGYRLRGTLDTASTERLGARGTVRIEGPRVPLVYWLLRRPLAALRETTGW